MNPKTSDYPCRCGHKKRKHGKIAGMNVCWVCFNMKRSALHDFIGDNLRYLENLKTIK